MSQETVNNVKRVTYLLAPRHWFFPAEPRDGARYEWDAPGRRDDLRNAACFPSPIPSRSSPVGLSGVLPQGRQDGVRKAGGGGRRIEAKPSIERGVLVS